MTLHDIKTPEDIRKLAADTISTHWVAFLIQGVILTILGLLAFALPVLSTVVIEIFIGWLFFIGGAVRAVTLAWTRHVPGFWWSMLSAVLAGVLGLVLVAAPLNGVLTLTLVLMVLFLVEGISSIFAALGYRDHSANWGWLLFSGVVDLVLVFLIWQGWPATATWAIGLLTGINLFFMGLSLTMLALAAKASGDRP